MSDLLQHLNPEQRDAVTHYEGPLLVIAGAGSGKTRVITHRIAHLILERHVEPWRIFAATFTNKAAREMLDRVARIVGPSGQARLSISTFHSLCARILRREAERVNLTPRFTILDDTDQKGVVRACMQTLKIDPKSLTPEQALNRIGLAKMKLLEPNEVGDLFGGAREDEYIAIYQEYERMLRENDAVDFDDLLMRVVRMLTSDAEAREHYQERYRHILIDEYQDTNFAQFRLAQLMAGDQQNICAVGDEDQSIYSWRGAEITNLLNFEKAFPGTRTIRLEQNYRSTKTILSIADHVIQRNTERLGKHLWSDGEQGPDAVVFAAGSSQTEARFVVEEIRKLHGAEGAPLSEFAVFYRVNALSRAFEDELRAANISYRVIGGVRFYDRMEVKDMLAYLQTVANPESDLALPRIINKPKRGIGDKSLEKLRQMAREKNISLNDAMGDPHILEALPKRAAGSIADFRNMLEKWRERLDRIPLHALVQLIVEDIGYIESLGDPDALESITRAENIDELIASIKQYEENAEQPSLFGYLEQVALTSSVDDAQDEEDTLSLLTLHAAKGLEFKVVFLVGLEENIFPSPRSLRDRGNVEEERRLFYVGITRAKRRLYVSWARNRMMYGRTEWNTPSLFLHELPEDYISTLEESDAAMAESLASEERMQQSNRRQRRRPRKSFREPTGPAYAVGQTVEHLFLGVGEVVGIEGAGQEKKILVRFEDGEVSEVVERYGDLKILG